MLNTKTILFFKKTELKGGNMQLLRIVKVFLLLAIVTSLVACSATPTKRSFKEGWKDSVISTKVKFKLMKDKHVNKRNFDVDAWRGVVTLTGRVRSLPEKERAEQLSWQVSGVRGVDNFLRIAEDADPGETVAGVEETEITEVAEGSGTKIFYSEDEEVEVKTVPTHPIKSKKAKVSNKVEGPVVYEENTKVKKWRATRGTYGQEVVEETSTTEDDLAREAAEELRRLRGE